MARKKTWTPIPLLLAGLGGAPGSRPQTDQFLPPVNEGAGRLCFLRCPSFCPWGWDGARVGTLHVSWDRSHGRGYPLDIPTPGHPSLLVTSGGGHQRPVQTC